MLVTFTPDFHNSDTWTWIANYHATGSSLRVASVPDAGSTGLCLAFAAGLLLFFRPRKENAWTS